MGVVNHLRDPCLLSGRPPKLRVLPNGLFLPKRFRAPSRKRCRAVGGAVRVHGRTTGRKEPEETPSKTIQAHLRIRLKVTSCKRPSLERCPEAVCCPGSCFPYYRHVTKHHTSWLGDSLDR